MTTSAVPVAPVALITGGCRGIGLGIARALADAGFNLALTGVRPASEVKDIIAQLSKECQKESKEAGKIRYFQSDLADTRRHTDLIRETEKELGSITALVLNAGIAQPVRGDLLEMSESDFDLVMHTNLRGNFFLASAVARQMLAKPAASGSSDSPDLKTFRSIQFITSVSARLASPQRSAYCISKAATSMASSLFALRLAAEGIAVYEVRPGIIATDMTSGVKSKYDRAIEEGLVPARKWGQAEDIGKSVAALAKGEFSFGTGSVINLDGGLSIQKL